MESSLISFKASLPSLRVLAINQVKKESKKNVSSTNDKIVVLSKFTSKNLSNYIIGFSF